MVCKSSFPEGWPTAGVVSHNCYKNFDTKNLKNCSLGFKGYSFKLLEKLTNNSSTPPCGHPSMGGECEYAISEKDFYLPIN